MQNDTKIQVINEHQARGMAVFGRITITLAPVDVLDIWLATPLPKDDFDTRTGA